MTPARDDPPKLSRWLLNRCSPSTDRSFLAGDFEEIYRALVEERGRPAARLWFRGQCLRFLPRIAVHSLFGRCAMLLNFLKVAWRNIRRQWLYAGINIVGLAVGFAGVLLIVLFIRSELSFDRFHDRAGRIYRLNTRLVMDGKESRQAVVAPAVAPAFRAACPEIEAAARVFMERNPVTIGTGERTFVEKRFFYADPEFFDVFSFPLIQGDSRTVLSEPRSLVLTVSTARKYFPRENPIGKILTVSQGLAKADYFVRGVAADVPVESHFHFDFLAPFSDLEISRVDNWFLQAGRAYVLLREGASPAALEAKVPPLIEAGARANFGSTENFRSWKAEGNVFEIFLQPLLDIRLRSADLAAQIEPVGDIAQVRIFGIIALVVLLIAVFNFVNLAAARAFQRAREVGVRKVLGSSRSLLVRQFLFESFLVIITALALSILPVLFFAPVLGALVGRPLSAAGLLAWPVPALIAAGAGITGLAAGAAPSLFLAAFRPSRVLHGQADPYRRPRFRGALVVFQFALSILLFIVTFIVSGQMRYIRAKDLGFDRERLLAVAAPPSLVDRIDAFKAELLKNPEIVSAACSAYLPGRPNVAEDFADSRGDQGKRVHLALLAGDEDFARTFGLPLVAGRFFSAETGADSDALVINEEAARRFRAAFGWEDPLGKSITTGRETGTIIGVLKDFHFLSLRRRIEPMAVQRLPRSEGPFVVVRTAEGRRKEAVGLLGRIWTKFIPNQPVDALFLDDEIGRQYLSEKRSAALLGGFSGFAVFLGCLGLFGLSALSVERRTKEIGVRKTFGASRRGLVWLLLRQSGAAVLAANVIAWPAAFLIMNRWLQGFAFRAELGPLPFFAAAALVLGLACAAAGGTAFRAASVDPVKALRYE